MRNNNQDANLIRTTFSLNYRPIRHAYFVLEQDAAAFTRAVQLCCSQWGGIRNLIIPVSVTEGLERASLHEHLLKLHEPDLFVDLTIDWATADYTLHNRVASQLRTLFPHRRIDFEMWRDPDTMDHSLHALMMVPPPERTTSDVLSVEFLQRFEWDENSALHLVLLAIFGQIYPGQENYYRERFHLAAIDPLANLAAFWKNQFERRPSASIINLTTHQLKARVVVGGMDSPTLEIVLVDTLESLCRYWNIRATFDITQFATPERRIFAFPIQWLEDHAIWDAFVDVVQQAIDVPNMEWNLDLAIISPRLEIAEQARDILSGYNRIRLFNEENIKCTHTLSRAPITRQARNYKDKPLTYLFTPVRVPQSFEEGISSELPRQVDLEAGRNVYLFTPPEGFRNDQGGAIGLDLRTELWQSYPNYQSSADIIWNNSYFTKYGLSNRIFVQAREQSLDFSLPAETEALGRFFHAKGYEVTLSSAGRAANAVIELLEGLEKCELLSNILVSLLLNELSLKSSKKVAQRIVNQLGLNDDALESIQRIVQDVEVVPELKRVPKTYRQLQNLQHLQPYRQDLLGTLSTLSANQLIWRGFHISCPNCDTPNWHPLRTAEEKLICPGCFFQFPLPIEYPRGSEIQWEYTLNSLVNRMMDHDALPHILALVYLNRQSRVHAPTPGLLLRHNGRDEAEFDFIGIVQGKVIGGECKTGAILSESDLAKIEQAGRLSLSRFYFVSSIEFSAETKNAIEISRQRAIAEFPTLSVEILEKQQLFGS